MKIKLYFAKSPKQQFYIFCKWTTWTTYKVFASITGLTVTLMLNRCKYTKQGFGDQGFEFFNLKLK